MATLRAGAELADLPVKNCVLISGSQTGVLAAERVAMPCVVIRNRYIFCWNPVSYLYCLGVFSSGLIQLSSLNILFMSLLTSFVISGLDVCVLALVCVCW